jgi:hypothetical protein
MSQQLQHDLPEFYNDKRKSTFLLDNFLEILLTTTVALVNLTCFTQQLLSDLGKIIEYTPNIHTVLSTVDPIGKTVMGFF